MGAKSWATPAQTAYLHTLMPDYVRRQAQGKLHLFWPTMTEGFFSNWSEHAQLGLPLPNDPNARKLTDEELVTLGIAIKARIKQLEAWFRYQRKKIRNTENASHGAGAAAALRAMFGVQLQKRKRAHKPIKIFQMRNPELVKTALTTAGYDNITAVDDDPDDSTDEADGTAAAGKKSLKSVRMRVRTRVVAALYAEASDEEIKGCEDAVLEEKEKLREEELAEENNESQERSPSQFQDICFGQTPAGNDFEETCVDFEENVAEPFEEFVRFCYTAAQCKERALPKVAAIATTAEAQPRVACRIPPPTVPVPQPKQKKTAKGKATAKQPAKSTVPASTAPAASTSPATVSPAPAASTNPATVSPASTNSASPTASAQDYENLDISQDGGTADDELMSAFGPSPLDWFSEGDNSFGENDITGTDADFAPMDTDSAPASTASRWPPGMTAPLSPRSAEALATAERGGLPSNATMAIDPNLDRLPTSPSPAPSFEIPQRPVPRAAYRGTTVATAAAAAEAAAKTIDVPTVNVGGFNFPLDRAQPSSYPVSKLFNYLRDPGRRAAPSGALASQWLPAPNATLSSPSSTATASFPASSPPSSLSPSSSPPSPPLSSPPTTLALPPSSQTAVSVPISTSSASNETASPKKGTYLDWRKKHLPGTAASSRDAIPNGPTKAAMFLTSLLVNRDSPANTTGPTGASSIAPLPTATPPGPTSPVADEAAVSDNEDASAFHVPLTRPPTKTSAPKKAVVSSTKAAGRKAAAKPAAAANADQKEAAAKAAQKVAVVDAAATRGRGRPRKQPAADALTDTTNLPPDEEEEVPVARRFRAPIDHAAINFRRRSKEAGEKEKAAEKAAAEKEAADQRALEAKRGWYERVVDGAQTVTLTTRTRKPAKHPDGSEITTKPARKTAAPVGTATSSKSRSWADASTTRAAAAASANLGTKRKAVSELTKDGKKKAKK
ncbi:hypothetical protein B0H16DRAFT_1747117 [Mycena metata]|uniref:Uncharacterized protein n=1 Tax=Mycena metata TaxID=1033252 RepID=A0AAD7GUZ0_9AGAR|nr:hypothetical protein B0H16DRAFT_1747117 [Mycena metata]